MTALAYASSLSGGWVFEDQRSDAADVYQETMPVKLWRPRSVTQLSHALTTRFLGDSPLAARSVSLAWHLLNGVLLWLVARRAVAEAAAVMAAGLWLLLPIQTEAVAGVAYRSELIAATWLLLALWCVRWPAVAFVFAAAAVTGKETGAMALALVPWWAWRFHRWTETQAVYWGIGAWIVMLAGISQTNPGFWTQAPSNPAVELAAVTSLLARMAWPAGLTIDHDWAAITAWMAGAAVVLWLGALATAWRRAWPFWGFALVWTLIALAPRLVLEMGEGVHERHIYTPAIAWCLVIGAALFPKGPYDVRA